MVPVGPCGGVPYIYIYIPYFPLGVPLPSPQGIPTSLALGGLSPPFLRFVSPLPPSSGNPPPLVRSFFHWGIPPSLFYIGDSHFEHCLLLVFNDSEMILRLMPLLYYYHWDAYFPPPLGFPPLSFGGLLLSHSLGDPSLLLLSFLWGIPPPPFH